MSGLRERQKADRHRRILGAASALFREVGYERANIETIAHRAEVSIGTIYNYYENKGDLLLAIVAMEVHEVLIAGEGLVDRPGADPLQAISELIGTYLEHSLVYLSKEMWRQAMAISTQRPDSPFGRTYAELDEKLSDQVCRLVARLFDCRSPRSSLDARRIGEVVFNNTNMMFILFVKDDEMSVETLKERIRHQNAALIGAISSGERARAARP